MPRLLGELVNTTVDGGGLPLNELALVIIGVVLLQSAFTFVAQRTSTLFGQDLLSTAREYIVRTILRLPLGAVESASTGDLVTRVTRDVGTMSRSVQYGLPMAIISLLTVVLSIGAMLLNSVVLAVPALLTFATSAWAVRSYLRRAPKGYITEGATYSRINTTLTETVEGARTLEALGLSGVRVRAGDDDIEVSAQAERYRHDAAQHPLHGAQLRLPDARASSPCWSAPTPTPAAGSTSARSPPPSCTSRRWATRSTG